MIRYTTIMTDHKGDRKGFRGVWKNCMLPGAMVYV